MPEEKEGKKPEGDGGVAKKEAEAGGRDFYRCWSCRAINHVPDYWGWFTCWNCGAFNRT